MPKPQPLDLVSRCWSCKWYAPDADPRLNGYCWRFPPLVFSGGLFLRPVVHPHDGCGEHQPADRISL